MQEPARPISQQPIVAVVGPTGSGKTRLAIAVAQALGGEVLGCDALQVRTGLPVLTAKPGPDELAQVPHHLIGVLPLDQAATAARYAALADEVLAQLAARGRPAVLCGGTGLYLRALCDGLFAGPPADPALRSELRQRAQTLGIAALHQQLAEVDPVAAARIGVADYVRIERALEVFLQTGRTLTDWFAEHQAERAHGPRYHTVRIALDPGPEPLRQAIAARVQHMLDAGLLDEVARQRELGPLSDPPLGYDLVGQHLDGTLSLDELRVQLAQQTAQYARRQRTWFRREEAVSWYPTPESVPIQELVASVMRRAA